MEAGAHDTVQNVFRKYRLHARAIPETWPNGNYTPSQLEMFDKAANEDRDRASFNITPNYMYFRT